MKPRKKKFSNHNRLSPWTTTTFLDQNSSDSGHQKYHQIVWKTNWYLILQTNTFMNHPTTTSRIVSMKMMTYIVLKPILKLLRKNQLFSVDSILSARDVLVNFQIQFHWALSDYREGRRHFGFVNTRDFILTICVYLGLTFTIWYLFCLLYLFWDRSCCQKKYPLSRVLCSDALVEFQKNYPWYYWVMQPCLKNQRNYLIKLYYPSYLGIIH